MDVCGLRRWDRRSRVLLEWGLRPILADFEEVVV